MKIKYSGPRPVITEHGISFKDGKEDKYVYLMGSLQILQAIDRSFDEKKSYSYDLKSKRLQNDEMLEILKRYEPNIEKVAEDEMIEYSHKLDEEIEQVDERAFLKDIEKKALKNNLKLMKDYRIQRAINKIYYMHTIEDIAKIIKREQIKEIDAPFYEKFWHILQTIQGELEEGRQSVHTDIEIQKAEDSEQLWVKLIMAY